MIPDHERKGGSKSQNWTLQNEKARVGCGRTEVYIRLDGMFFCALLSEHGQRNPCYQGVWKILEFQ